MCKHHGWLVSEIITVLCLRYGVQLETVRIAPSKKEDLRHVPMCRIR